MGDYGLMLDTLECSVNWDNFTNVYENVRRFCKSRPDTICMTHMSHFYPQGANLYFIFEAKMNDLDEYLEYQRGIMDNIQKYGAAMSHHHGIGKMTAPWLEAQIGKNQMDIYRAQAALRSRQPDESGRNTRSRSPRGSEERLHQQVKITSIFTGE